MKLNRVQFFRVVQRVGYLRAGLNGDYPELKLRAVFSRFGLDAGQCDMTTDLRKIVLDFPSMLSPCSDVSLLRQLGFKIKKGEPLACDPGEVENRLLDPDLKLYCGDVLVEYRCGVLKYDSIRRLQQDSRLPAELNTVGSIRVVAGSLAGLSDVD